MEYFRHVVALPSLSATGAKLSFNGFVTGELWIALVTFLYIDFLDTTGTLFSMASFINNYIPGARARACAVHHPVLLTQPAATSLEIGSRVQAPAPAHLSCKPPCHTCWL